MSDPLSAQLSANIAAKVGELASVWDYVGYEDQEKSRRSTHVAVVLNGALADLIKKENEDRLEIERKVETARRQATELAHSLDLPVLYPDRGISPCKLIKVFEEKCAELQSIKEHRAKRFQSVQENLRNYRRLLNKLPNDRNETSEAHVTGVPSESALEQLEQEEAQLQAEYTPLLEAYRSLCQDNERIVVETELQLEDKEEAALFDECKAFNQGDRAANDDLPRIDRAKLEALEAWRSRLIKSKMMLMSECDESRERLERLWERLDVETAHRSQLLNSASEYTRSNLRALKEEIQLCDQMKWNMPGKYIAKLKAEADFLSSKCCKPLQPLDPKRTDKTAIEELERTIGELQDCYEANRTIYDDLESYVKCWDSLAEVERKLRDPATLANRGGILLKTEKEKKRMLREVQESDARLRKAMEDYQAQTGHSFTLYDQSTFVDLASRKKADHEAFLDSLKVKRAGRAASAKNGPPGGPT